MNFCKALQVEASLEILTILTVGAVQVFMTQGLSSGFTLVSLLELSELIFTEELQAKEAILRLDKIYKGIRGTDFISGLKHSNCSSYWIRGSISILETEIMISTLMASNA